MRVEEYGKSVTTAGFKLNETVVPREFISKARTAVQPSLIQLFDATSVAGSTHLLFATINALKAFKQGRGIAQSLDVEVLLYVSAQRQISKAIRRTGLQTDGTEVAAVLIADDDRGLAEAEQRLMAFMPGKRDDSVLDVSENKRKRLMELYGVTELELQAVSDSSMEDVLPWLIVERCALLDVRR